MYIYFPAQIYSIRRNTDFRSDIILFHAVKAQTGQPSLRRTGTAVDEDIVMNAADLCLTRIIKSGSMAGDNKDRIISYILNSRVRPAEKELLPGILTQLLAGSVIAKPCMNKDESSLSNIYHLIKRKI